jgi:hypothetical protein
MKKRWMNSSLEAMEKLLNIKDWFLSVDLHVDLSSYSSIGCILPITSRETERSFSVLHCTSNQNERRVNLYIFLFCGSYFLRFKTISRDFLWHTITNIISTCFIFGELKMVAKNAKIRLPRKILDIRYFYSFLYDLV